MRLKPIVTALCAGALLAAPFASAKELKAIGVTVGDLANPFLCRSPRARSWKPASWRG